MKLPHGVKPDSPPTSPIQEALTHLPSPPPPRGETLPAFPALFSSAFLLHPPHHPISCRSALATPDAP